MSPDRVDRFFY